MNATGTQLGDPINYLGNDPMAVDGIFNAVADAGGIYLLRSMNDSLGAYSITVGFSPIL